MTTWRFALRSVRRGLARSILVIALIAIPVAGATVADGLVRTTTDRDVDVDRAMGNADLLVKVAGRNVFVYLPRLPKGSDIVPIGSQYLDGSLRLVVGDRIIRTKLDVVVLDDPLTRHISRLVSGRLPKGPNEVLVTRSLAERLGVLDGDVLRPGAKARVDGGPVVTVTGVSENPYYLTREAVVAPPGSVLEKATLDSAPHPRGALVDLPDGVDPAAIVRAWPLTTDRSTAATRESFVDSTPVSGYLLDAAGGPIALFAGLGLLAIVLTAGAAFAMGTRQQMRELGLVAVNGGSAKHIRRVVLAQGVVLGVLGAASGLVLGATATVLGTPLWQRLTGQLMENLRFGWGELAAAAGIGVLASVLAAVVPAFGVARVPAVDALAGRFRVATPRARLPLLGMALAIGGVACVVVAGMTGRHRLIASQGEPHAPPLNLTFPIVGILFGTLLAMVGLLLVVPALLAAVGRLGGWLPLSGRLAVRDAVRHRSRIQAAVAVVMVTVAGSVAATFVTAQADNEPKTLPDNVVLAQLDPYARYKKAVNGPRELERAAAGMTAAAPGVVAHEVTLATAYPEDGLVGGSLFVSPVLGPRCTSLRSPMIGIGTPAMVALSTGREPDAGVRSALAEGKVVVFDDCLVTANGMVRIETNIAKPVELPAYRAERAPSTTHFGEEYLFLPGAFISARAAAALGWGTFANAVVATHPASADVAAMRSAADAAGVDTFVEESVSDRVTNLSLALAGIAALVALLGAAVTVALAAADGRSDLATLAALGAQPRRRRTLVGAQALVVTGVGTLAGLVVGGCVGFAATPLAGVPRLAIPWNYLLLTAVCVPLVATIVAMVATPSRLPMIVRRQS